MEKIGNIKFRNLLVPIYYSDDQPKDDSFIVSWSVRNDKSYKGIVYIKNGKITFPEDAIIPEEPSEFDKEWIPKGIVVGFKVDETKFNRIYDSLKIQHANRNKCRMSYLDNLMRKEKLERILG